MFFYTATPLDNGRRIFAANRYYLSLEIPSKSTHGQVLRIPT